MGFQIKGFSFLIVHFVVVMLAICSVGYSEQDLDVIRVTNDEKGQRLETSLLRLENNGVEFDLIGVIHLADEKYYDDLNARFQEYDAVFYEMIGDGTPPEQRIENETQASDRVPVDEMDVVSQMYDFYTSLLEVEPQKKGIDYSANNFVHADLSRAEFQKQQSLQEESVMGYALSQAELFEDVDQATLLSAMLSGDSSLLKSQLMGVLASADQSQAPDGDTSVIISVRNDHCLQVAQEYLEENEGAKRVAIFYGAAHLPDFVQKLEALGWRSIDQLWLPAWSVDSER